jgi:hypothetical protein
MGTIRGVMSQPRAISSVRQTVTGGSVNVNRLPNALAAGSGLAIVLSASIGTPFSVSFAQGPLDFPATLTANQTLSGLTANSFGCVFVDRNVATGALSLGWASLLPVYQVYEPASPATNQHWFDLNSRIMYRWSGSAWDIVQRVFIGEFTTGASTVTGVRNYAYNGIYDSGWFLVGANTVYTAPHNLGMFLPQGLARVSLYQNNTATDSSVMVLGQSITHAPSNTISFVYTWGSNVDLAFVTGSFVGYINGTWLTTGYYKLIVDRGW